MKSLATLVLCLCLTAEAAPTAAKLRATAPARPEKSWVVDIHELVPSLRPMPQKEREDQLRDWALYGLLMKLNLSANELARTTHQLAPVRLPYLEELFAFDYGRGRRAILSDDRVLLLYEQTDPDPQATLGRLADRVRMETGAIPRRFEVYTFSSNVEGGELSLQFKEALPGPELFSRVYGYSEAVVAGQEQLGAWLEGVDDVVYAAQVPGGVKLGGRRFDKSRTRNVRLEDVAALYQAHVSLAAQQQQQLQWREDLKQQLRRQLKDSLHDEEMRVSALYPGDLLAQERELERRMTAQAEDFMRSAQRGHRYVPPEPGFSLDPKPDAQGLVTSLETLAEDPCRALGELWDKAQAAKKRLKDTQAWHGSVFSDSLVFDSFYTSGDVKNLQALCQELSRNSLYTSRLREIAEAARGLKEGVPQREALAPLYALRNELQGSQDPLEQFTWQVLDLAEEVNAKQCARYDGPLGGTRVGMNLFYTDLLAKLWFLDVNYEAPGLRVPGFVSMGRLPPSPYRQEDLEKSYTRLWFGPKREAFTRSPESTELRFQHVATRVFAAGSNANQLQGQEGVPNENSRRAIGWWERHYADVADYEQEYHLQNQIMKWSVITGFFREKGLAPYLDQVLVARKAQFGTWYADHRSELKYQLPLVVEGEASRECMDILASRSGLMGGVSLSGGKLERVPVVKRSAPAALRHSVQAMTGGRPVAQELGRAFPTHVRPGVIQVDPLPTTRARSQAVQFELGQVQLGHARTKPGSYALSLESSQTRLGDFYGKNTAGRTTLSWHSRQMGDALGVGQKAHARGEAVFVQTQTVGTRPPRRGPSHPWQAEVRGPDGASVLIPSATGGDDTLVVLSKTALPSKDTAALAGSPLKNADWQQLSIAEGAAGLKTSQGVVRTAVNTGPGLGGSFVRVMGLKDFPDGLTVVVSVKGGVFVPRPSEASQLKSWLALDKSAALTAKDLPIIREAAMRGESTVALAQRSHPKADLAARALAGEDTAQFARLNKALAQELGPEQSRQEILQSLEDAADLQLARGNPSEATRLYDLAREHLGPGAPAAEVKQTLGVMAQGKTGPGTLDEVLRRHAEKLSLPEKERVLQAAQGLKDLPDVPDVVRARMRFEGPISQDVAPRIHLESHGPDTVSAYHSQKPPLAVPSSPDDFKQGVPKDATLYVESGFSFNKNDFQANPAASVAELGRNPHVEFVRVLEMETGTYRPGKLYVPEKTPQGPAFERTYERVSGPREGDAALAPVYFIRQTRDRGCDSNKDGQVTVQELEQCKAA